MTTQELLAWGAKHNYPQLMLTQTFPCDLLRAGEQAWHGLVESNNETRLQRAIARIVDFENRYACRHKRIVQAREQGGVA